MKLPSLLLSAVLLFQPVLAFAQAANDRVRLEVRLNSRTERSRKDSQDNDPRSKTQNITLDILASGKFRQSETRVIQWYVFGKSTNSNEISIIGSGEEPLDLSKFSQQKFTTPVVSTTSTTIPRSERQNRQDNNENQNEDDGGMRYFGYGVQVKDGDVVLGKVFNPQNLEQMAK